MAANDHRQAILQVLDQLPPLHQVAQKLIALMNDDRSSARDLDKLIRNDQALTARILKLANSSAYGKSRDIFQLTEAVVLLGHATITNMVLGVSVADVVSSGADQEFAARAWEHSLDCAAVAQALAETTGCVEPENAFVAGLLHDIGLLVQAQAVPEVLHEVIAAVPEDPLAAERQAMGLNHAQVGMKLLNQWLLPSSLCEAVRFHHSPDRKFMRTNPLVLIVALADQLATIAGTTPYPGQKGPDIFHLLRDLGIDSLQFEPMFAALDRSRDNARGLLDEVQLTAQVAGPPVAEDEPQTLAVYAADERRLAWYTAVLRHLGFATVTWPFRSEQADVAAPAFVVVDFHGASPEERQQLGNIVQRRGLVPLVVGDPRRTPGVNPWQGATHLSELFTQAEIGAVLNPAAAPTP